MTTQPTNGKASIKMSVDNPKTILNKGQKISMETASSNPATNRTDEPNNELKKLIFAHATPNTNNGELIWDSVQEYINKEVEAARIDEVVRTINQRQIISDYSVVKEQYLANRISELKAKSNGANT